MVAFPVAYEPPFVPSHNLAYIFSLLFVNSCVAVLLQFVLSLLVCSVNPVTVVLAVAITFPFVQLEGLYENVVFATVKSVTLVVAVDLLVLIFPTASFTHT